jgi:hypothetical protein
MRNFGFLAILLAGACGAGPEAGPTVESLSQAAVVDYFLRLDGIDGEATQRSGHVEMISLAVTPTGAQGLVRAIKTCDVSPCQTVAMTATVKGTDLATKVLQHPIRIHVNGLTSLKDLPWRGNVHIRPTGNSEQPVETMNINFSKIEVDYTSPDPLQRWTPAQVSVTSAPGCYEASDCDLQQPPPPNTGWECVNHVCVASPIIF